MQSSKALRERKLFEIKEVLQSYWADKFKEYTEDEQVPYLKLMMKVITMIDKPALYQALIMNHEYLIDTIYDNRELPYHEILQILEEKIGEKE